MKSRLQAKSRGGWPSRGEGGCLFRATAALPPVGLVFFSLFLGLGALRLAGADAVIEGVGYTNSAAAQRAWVAQAGSPLAQVADGGDWGTERILRLPCDFSAARDRCYWDRAVSMDLSAQRSFALDIFVPDSGAISALTLYFRSGSGWYGQDIPITRTGWQTLFFPKRDFTPEGVPAGWNRISAVRLSPWKEATRNTFVGVRQLRAFTPLVFVVRDTDAVDATTVDATTKRVAAWLGQYGVPCEIIPSGEVASGYLAGSRLAILPYNEVTSDPFLTQLESYVGAGGKLMVFYQLPARIQTLLGFQRTGWTQGDFESFTFSESGIAGLPARVRQSSWNITLAAPTTRLRSRVIATWEDSAGAPTGRAAWLASDNGLFMSHILLGDDAGAKKQLLLAMVGHYVPEIWPLAATRAVADIGRIASYLSYEEAVSGIRASAALTPRALNVAVELEAAETARSSAMEALTSGGYPAALELSKAARNRMQEAYYLGQKPAFDEFRAVWTHSGTGPYPGNWTAAISALATNGFTAIFPNMLWGGLAHYNSSLLPRSADFERYGDQITACVNAAHARGIEVHVWKVNWNLAGAPRWFIDSMRGLDRTQVSANGQPLDWLCPSHPDNLALERASMLEVVRNYEVDGIHLDYIRYPDADHCFCAGCRARFQSQTGTVVANWPDGVLVASPVRTAFLRWRRGKITDLVRAVHTESKALKPQVRISAAVFPDYASAFDGVGQDWVGWIDEGIVDFLCPMDYTEDSAGFRAMVSRQAGYAAGRVPIYPGIGPSATESQLGSDAVIDQILATREAGTGGFIVFQLDQSVAERCLPDLAKGVTAADEPDADGDRLADAWESQWFGGVGVSDGTTDADHDGTSDGEEYAAGTDPTDGASRLRVAVRWDGAGVAVVFEARGALGIGYHNLARHYRLETSAGLAPDGVWTPVAGYEDRVAAAGTTEIAVAVSPISGGTAFYRARVWLQQALW